MSLISVKRTFNKLEGEDKVSLTILYVEIGIATLKDKCDVKNITKTQTQFKYKTVGLYH